VSIILDGHAATGNNWRKSRSAIGDYSLVPYKSDLTKTTSCGQTKWQTEYLRQGLSFLLIQIAAVQPGERVEWGQL
jgi:hypothetical protein